MKYARINQHRNEFPITGMCRVLGVSRSGFYDSWNLLQSERSKRPAANLLDREFTATSPNQKWVIDITYLATAAGWIYLAAVVDLFSHKVVGWAVSQSLATELVQAALKDVVEKR